MTDYPVIDAAILLDERDIDEVSHDEEVLSETPHLGKRCTDLYGRSSRKVSNREYRIRLQLDRLGHVRTSPCNEH